MRIGLRSMAKDCFARRVHTVTNYADIGKIYPSRVIDYHKDLGVDEDIALGNMSFCSLDDGNFLVSVRQFNYMLSPGSAKCNFIRDFMLDRGYHFIVVDQSFKFMKRLECDFNGLDMKEDIRLVRFGDIIQASGTDVSYGSGHHRMSCSILKMDEKGLRRIRESFFPVEKEKNYIPVEGGQGVFLTDLMDGCINISTLSNVSKKTAIQCSGLRKYRGSSQLVRYGGGYVALVHRRDHERFYNAFAFFDKGLLTCRISDEFVVFRDESPISFCCGMSVSGDIATLPMCVHDKTTHLFELPLTDFRATAKARV